MRTGRTSGRTIWPRHRTYSAVGPVAAAKTPTYFALLALVLAGSLPAAAGASGQRYEKPRNLKAPRITGTKVVGHSLAASRGRWARHPTRYRYSWRRCNVLARHCHAVTGARKRVYRLAAGDAGKRMRVVVTASNRGGGASGDAGRPDGNRGTGGRAAAHSA